MLGSLCSQRPFYTSLACCESIKWRLRFIGDCTGGVNAWARSRPLRWPSLAGCPCGMMMNLIEQLCQACVMVLVDDHLRSERMWASCAQGRAHFRRNAPRKQVDTRWASSTQSQLVCNSMHLPCPAHNCAYLRVTFGRLRRRGDVARKLDLKA